MPELAIKNALAADVHLFDRVRQVPASAWVQVFGLKNAARGHRCPSCGNPWFTFASVNGQVSGHCWGAKRCSLQGWGYVVGAKLWGINWEQAAERFLELAPQVAEQSDITPTKPRKRGGGTSPLERAWRRAFGQHKARQRGAA